MPVTSKTGLMPSVRKAVKVEAKERVTFKVPNLAIPAPFILRPFAGIYNPFPYGCSVLCNHPTDYDAKAIVQKAKNSWAAEIKSQSDKGKCETLKHKKEGLGPHYEESTADESIEGVAEKLLRKLMGIESRPLTPAPTLASVATRVSQNLVTRRCLTPDPVSVIPTKEKTHLVLDLRRSHSQETLCWKQSQKNDEAFGPIQDENRSLTPVEQNKKKKTPRKKSIASSDTASSLKTQNSRDSDSKLDRSNNESGMKNARLSDHEDNLCGRSLHGSPENSAHDSGMIKRRGKKRKGKKSGKDGKEGEKEFKGIPDPGETQVSALGSDSNEGSSRPSLSGSETLMGSCQQEIPTAETKPPSGSQEEKHSFLNAETLKQLQRQLDQEMVDSEMNTKKRIALEEALRHKAKVKMSLISDEMKMLKKIFPSSIKESEKWLTTPRVFTRRSARFELPMDSRLLNEMTPLAYVQNYVFPSPERLALYNHVFNQYKEEPEDDEETERKLAGKNIIECLGKIMGRPLSESEAADYQALIGWKNEAEYDFRTFAGIGAACERLLCPRFCPKMPSQKEDPRFEVEKADFATLEGKLSRLQPDYRLVRMLRSFRDL